jgi:uncharacterized protein (TIGR02598 family)
MKVRPLMRGFSLVEIVLAMGVISFAMVGILGLLSVSYNSRKASMDESLIAAMSRQIVASLQQQRFSGNSLFTGIQNNSQSSTILTVFFDSNGTRLQNSNGQDLTAASAQTLYQCEVAAQWVSNGLGPSPKVAASTASLLDLKLTFTWPVGVKKPSTYIIHTNLAKYY